MSSSSPARFLSSSGSSKVSWSILAWSFGSANTSHFWILGWFLCQINRSKNPCKPFQQLHLCKLCLFFERKRECFSSKYDYICWIQGHHQSRRNRNSMMVYNICPMFLLHIFGHSECKMLIGLTDTAFPNCLQHFYWYANIFQNEMGTTSTPFLHLRSGWKMEISCHIFLGFRFLLNDFHFGVPGAGNSHQVPFFQYWKSKLPFCFPWSSFTPVSGRRQVVRLYNDIFYLSEEDCTRMNLSIAWRTVQGTTWELHIL